MSLALLPDGVSLSGAGILVLSSFFTSALTAAAGIGGGMIMLALMTYLVPFHALIPVHGAVQFGSNAGRSFVQRTHIDWRVARWFLVGSAVGATLGVMLAVQLPKAVLQAGLGLFILVLLWTKLPKLTRASVPVIMLGGGLTTFISMFAGATGPLVAVFLNNLLEAHRKLVATHGITMTAQHGFKVFAYALVGFSFWHWLPLIAAIVASGYIGTLAGTRLMNKLPEKTLNIAFKTVLTLVALDLLRRGAGL